MRSLSHFGSSVAALALGLTLAAAGPASAAATGAALGADAPALIGILGGAASMPGPASAANASTPPAPPLPGFGNPGGHAYVPPAGQAVSSSHPDHVIGRGTPTGCTSAAVVSAVAEGGVITFDCGPKPVTITMTATAKVVNTSHLVVLDGGGLVTLSGAGQRQILYLDTCDPNQKLTTDDCFDQQWPQLVVQNMTFEDGYSAVTENPHANFGGGGGGAIYAEGGQLKVVNSRFLGNRCYATGPDLGGAAIRALAQYQDRPVYITSDTFRGGVCSNGGALSSIDVNWDVINSVMAGNQAIGWGANPASAGTPGGGSGGAIYTDGDNYNVVVAGTVIRDNSAREGGGAIFFVVDNNQGTLTLTGSALDSNPSGEFFTPGYPGIFYHSSGHPIITASTTT
jgi:hypothetical protein